MGKERYKNKVCALRAYRNKKKEGKMSDTQLVHELSIPELNEMPKEKRLELVRKLESKHAKFTCSACTKNKISTVHFSLGDQWLVTKLLCSNCFSSQMVSVKKKGFFESLGKKRY